MEQTSILLALLVSGPFLVRAQQPAFRDPNLPVEQRITSILASMALDEKLAALGTDSGVARLGIPNAGNSEGIHGLVQGSTMGSRGPAPPAPTTQFAQTVGMAMTWDPNLIRGAAAAVGKLLGLNEQPPRSVSGRWNTRSAPPVSVAVA
ncbi:MAG: hypothetical protein U0Q16_21950 [Bryobacteraceae bacterium]